MKNFLAIYIGSASALEQSGWNSLDEASRKQREQAGMGAWKKWAQDNASAIVSLGSPIGKTRCVSSSGIADIKNRITAYAIVQAESHEAAAKLFEHHPHFMIFPGDSIEVMECLPMPGA